MIDPKLQAAIDALLEIKDSAHSSTHSCAIAKKALTKIWCDYYFYTHQNAIWGAHDPALPLRMVE